MKTTTMAVQTRSKLGGQKEKETDKGTQVKNTTRQKEVLDVMAIEKELATESFGVKIKKERLEDILEANPTDLQQERRSQESETVDMATAIPVSLRRSTFQHVNQGRSARFSDGRTDRKTDKHNSTSTGKRRLFNNKTIQRNKKYFQDIRRYAQATLTNDLVGHTYENTVNRGKYEHTDTASLKVPCKKNEADHLSHETDTRQVKKTVLRNGAIQHDTSLNDEDEIIDVDMETYSSATSMEINETSTHVTETTTQKSQQFNEDKRLSETVDSDTPSHGSHNNLTQDDTTHVNEDKRPSETLESSDTRYTPLQVKKYDSLKDDAEQLNNQRSSDASVVVDDRDISSSNSHNKVRQNNAKQSNKDKRLSETFATSDDSVTSAQVIHNTFEQDDVKRFNYERLSKALTSLDDRNTSSRDSHKNSKQNNTEHLKEDERLSETLFSSDDSDTTSQVNHNTSKKDDAERYNNEDRRPLEDFASLEESDTSSWGSHNNLQQHNAEQSNEDKRSSETLESSDDSDTSSQGSHNKFQHDDADPIDYNAMMSSYDIPDDTPLQEEVEEYEARTRQSSVENTVVNMDWNSAEPLPTVDQMRDSKTETYIGTAVSENNSELKRADKNRLSKQTRPAKNLRIIPVRDTGVTVHGIDNHTYERRLVPRYGPATEALVKSKQNLPDTPAKRYGKQNSTQHSGGPLGVRKDSNTPQFKTKPNQFTIIAKSISSIDQTMRERGLDMVEDKTLWVTPVKIEFNIDKQILQYNVREQVNTLLKKMQEVDSSLKIKSAADDTVEWTVITELPEDGDFSTHFKVNEFSFRKMRKVVVYMTLVTKLHINRIKYSEQVKEHLFSNNIWFKPDRFENKVESSPGVITMIHPKLINRDDYKEELKDLLQSVLPDFNEQDNTADTKLVAKEKAKTTGRRTGIPTFFLETSVKKWRDLSVEVVRINCAKEDSDFLKILLSFLSEQNGFKRGVFVPEGLHLIEGKELVYNILQAHEAFLRSITSIPLSGILAKDLSVVIPKKKKSLRDLILSLDGVESLERSRDRFRAGNFSVLVNRQKTKSVLDCLEKNIADFYTSQSGQTRMVRVGQTRMKTSNNTGNSVMSYAEALSTKYQISHTDQTKQSDTGIVSRTSEPNNALGDNSTKLVDKRQVKEHAAVSPVLHSKQQPEDSMQKQILLKLKDMELKQADIQKKQEQLQKEQKQKPHKQQTGHNPTKPTFNEQAIEEIINTKMVAIQKEQDIKLREMETKIKLDVGEAIEQKADSISVTVGNYVTAQLMGLFQQYLIPKETKETHVIRAKQATPMITQEGQVTPIKPGNLLTDAHMEDYPPSKGTDTTEMLQALNEIDPTTNRPCSPHDKLKEQSEAPC